MIAVDCPSSIIQRFKKKAKAAFPKETLSFLYGQIVGNHVYIDGIWTPPNIDEHCGHSVVYMQPEWDIEAIEYAKEHDAQVCGTIHSHPFRRTELDQFVYPDHAQSQADIEACGMAWEQISGICRVLETRSGRLRASVKFWGPTVPLAVKITSVKSIHHDD